MQKMILNNKKEFYVKSVMDFGNALEITFSEGTSYEEVAMVYDKYNNETFDEENLRRFELYNEQEELQGVHIGYTQTQNISAFNGVVIVKIQKELELKTDVVLLQQENKRLAQYVSDLEITLMMNGVI